MDLYSCPACQNEISDTARFCGQCGHRLLRKCPDCGHEVRLSAKFCDECGAGLSETERPRGTPPSPTGAAPDPSDSADASSPLLPPSAEWRQLTVMFCDLADSARLSSQLDPEEYREVIKAYQKTCCGVIDTCGGHVAQYLGDGLLIYFGYPMAAEDAPQSAIRTGLGILEAMARLNSGFEHGRGLRLAVRIGIHTGLVVVGSVGEGERSEHLALGEAPNVAARIQSSAEPDSVVVSETTLNLVPRRFTCREIGAPPLKGIQKRLSLFRILGESEAAKRLEAPPASHSTPMVGRRNRIEFLLTCWSRATEGQGQVVVLSGEAGIGKSRLVGAVHESVAGVPSVRVEYRCSPLARNSALSPVIGHLQRSWGLGAEEPAETRLDRLESRLAAYSFPRRESVPLLAALLSIPVPDGRYPPLPMSPQRQWRKTQQILVEALLEDSERLPLLLVWEDLHWADPTSLELIDQIVVQVPTARIFFLLTCRPSSSAPGSSLSHATRLTIDRLSRPQVEEMISRLCRGKSLPREVVDLLVERTDGVPLYVEELTKMVLATELLRESEDGWELTGPLPRLAVPTSLQDSLMARLDRLEPARDVVYVAAALGREFSYRLLAAVSRMDGEALSRILAQLVREDLLYQRGVPPDSRYAFKHSLIQHTAYQSLLRSTRHRYHARIAKVLIRKLPGIGEVRPEQVAYHFTEAGLFEQAARYWQTAGTEAARRSAHREAIHHLNKGLELVAELPASNEKRRLELALNMSLGEPLTFVRGESDAAVERVFFRSWQLCQELEEDPRLFPALFGLFTHYIARADLSTVHDLGRQLLRLAERGNQPPQLFSAHFALGMAASVSAEPASGLCHYEEAIALANAMSELDAAQRLLLVRCLALSTWNLWLLGQPDRALARLREADAHARAVAHPFGRALVLATFAMLHQHRREPGEVSAPAQAAVRMSEEQGFPIFVRIGTILEGWAQVELERSADGLARIRRELDAWRATGFKGMLPYLFLLLADACLRLGLVDDGLTAVDEALTLIDETGERLWEAELHRLRGELLLQVPSTEGNSGEPRAEICFQRALELARRQEARSLELRAALSLGRLWRSQGRSEEAHDVLSRARDGFTESLGTADLEDSEDLLGQLPRPRERRRS